MNKKETITILKEIIKELYETDSFCNTNIKKIEEKIKRIKSIIPESKFTREINIILKSCLIAKEERKEHLKIALISDLEFQVKKIEESIKEEEKLK